MPNHGTATYPGISQITSASMTLSHGISPSLCQLEIAPQAGIISEIGTLTLRFGDTVIVFPQCRINSASYRRSQSGKIVSLAVQDRRWKWKTGEIHLHANLRLENGDLDTNTEWTPQQIAVECLSQMGETNYNVGDLPNDSRPLVEWDYANPAQELARLCDDLGCRIILQLDNTVAIRRIGGGAELPIDQSVQENNVSINPPERPDKLTFACGKTRYQVELNLTAVGVDTDGAVKALDSLSYKPTGGWAGEIPGIFASVTAGDVRKLAIETVYRWYQITPAASGFFSVPGYEDGNVPNDPFPLIAIDDEQVDTTTEASVKKNKKAEVNGTFLKTSLAYTNEAGATVYRRSFEIDKTKAIVKFDNYVVKFNASNQFIASDDLKLKCAVTVRSEVNRAWARYFVDRPNPQGQFGTGARILMHDEVNLNYSGGVAVNQATVDAEAQHWLNAAEAEYQTTFPQEVQYAGLKQINPDGAIHQVAWTIGRQGTTTKASRNTEFSPVVPSYKERRDREKLRAGFVDEAHKVLARVRK